MACSLVKTENPDEVPEVKPEYIALEDACDRALRKRKRAAVRLDVDLVGYWPDNRGGAGVIPRHIHEVAQDLMKNKIRLSRYDPVELFELPEPVLKKFKAQNKAKCENDPLMPRYSPKMEYVCLTKTHFTHACKLIKDGDHTLFGKPNGTPIRLATGDSEGAEVMKHGVNAVIFEKEQH